MLFKFYWTAIIISITSAFDIVEFRWYFLFPVGFSVYFAVIASKNLQKSSAIQNISVTLSSVIIAIFVCNCLYISSLKLQQISLITKFIDTYNSSNSRYLFLGYSFRLLIVLILQKISLVVKLSSNPNSGIRKACFCPKIVSIKAQKEDYFSYICCWQPNR